MRKDRADLQICFMPLALDFEAMKPVVEHGFQLFGMPLRPTSTGAVTLKSAGPLAAPSILRNYLSTEKNRQDFPDLIALSLGEHPMSPGPKSSVATARIRRFVWSKAWVEAPTATSRPTPARPRSVYMGDNQAETWPVYLCMFIG